MVLPHESFSSASGFSSFVWDQNMQLTRFLIVPQQQTSFLTAEVEKNKEPSLFRRLLVKAVRSGWRFALSVGTIRTMEMYSF